MAVKKIRRGPKKGKRITPEILSEIVLSSIRSRESLEDIIEKYRSEGFNVKKDIEEIISSIGLQEISFMLGNIQVIKSIREEAVADFIKDIQTK